MRARSFGQHAKTDFLDAKALSLYACERQGSLARFQKTDVNQEKLKLLVERRQDLKQMLVQEKNRYKAPLNGPLQKNIRTVF